MVPSFPVLSCKSSVSLKKALIEKNVNYFCAIIISIHLMLSFFYYFFVKNNQSLLPCVIKIKQIDNITNIMSKGHGVSTENFTIFFSNEGKTENGLEFEFERFYKIIFGRLYTCNIYNGTSLKRTSSKADTSVRRTKILSRTNSEGIPYNKTFPKRIL